MKNLRVAVSTLIALGGLMLSMTPASAKLEYSKKEKKGCTTCHVTAKSKELNDTGKCYGEKKTLEACPTPKS